MPRVFILFTGTIDTRIGALTDLDFLQMQNNSFTGTLPTEIGLLTKLETFNVHVNKFTGEMPEEVCALTNTAQFDLSSLIADCVCPSAQGGIPPFSISCECCTGCGCSQPP